MRIALLGSGMLPVPPEGYGAVEKHVWNLAHALARRGHEIRIVSRVFGRAPWNEYRFARWALGELRRLAPDVVHVHTTGVAAAFAAVGRRFVYTTHSRHWMSARGPRERAGFALERYAVGRARRVVALTDEVAAAVRRRRPQGVHVVPNGVDPEAYRPDWERRRGNRALAVGVLTPHKRQDLALRAAREAGWELTLAGPVADEPYAARLRADGAVLAGTLPDADLAALYAASDALIHLSTSEALSMAVLEGMSAGLPLVASDICRGQVLAGETGFPIPTGAPDPQRVAAAAEALRDLSDPALRRRMGEAARQVARRDFSWAAVAERLESVYAEAAA